MKIITRMLSKKELDIVMYIQKSSYSSDLIERKNTFVNKMKLFPEGCVGAFIEEEMLGYLFFHPWMQGCLTPLNKKYPLPIKPDCLFIHDLAIKKRRRGLGVGSILFMCTVENYGIQQGINNYSLVAVQSSEEFWGNKGFVVERKVPYGDGVGSYMTRAWSNK